MSDSDEKKELAEFKSFWSKPPKITPVAAAIPKVTATPAQPKAPDVKDPPLYYFNGIVPSPETRALGQRALKRFQEQEEKELVKARAALERGDLVLMNGVALNVPPINSAIPQLSNYDKLFKPLVDETIVKEKKEEEDEDEPQKPRTHKSEVEKFQERKEHIKKLQIAAAPFYAKMDAINWGWPMGQKLKDPKPRRAQVYLRAHTPNGKHEKTWKQKDSYQQKFEKMHIEKLKVLEADETDDEKEEKDAEVKVRRRPPEKRRLKKKPENFLYGDENKDTNDEI